jgi:hypothetical protein
MKTWNTMKFLPLYSYPNPFHRGWPGCWLNQCWIVKHIRLGNLKYDVQWYGICDLMSQWMGIGRFLRRKHAGVDENCIYISKSTLQVLPSKNEHWQPISGWLMGKRICSWGVFAATHWVHWRTQNDDIGIITEQSVED